MARPVALAIGDLLPLALLAASAAVRPLRLPLLAVLVAGTATARAGDHRRLPAWAATLPVAVSLVWGLVPLPLAATDGSTCASPLAPFATWRVVEAVLSLATLAALAPLCGSGGGELGVRRPGRRLGAVSLIAGVVAGPLGLLVGPALAAPFFGHVELDLGQPMLLLPAMTFALANGIMEEAIYRGGLLTWTARVTGPRLALLGQAAVFGLAHGAGPDVGGSPVVLVLVMAAAGLGAGWIARRTSSLALPVAVHVGLDLPLYVGNACRIA